ncbi:thioesterase II family protein [Nocardia thraciensis]
MHPKPRWIRQFHQPHHPDAGPLLIFPHAGAGASTYRAFSKALSSTYDVIVFQYPGRQDRAMEPAPDNLPEFAAGAFAEFRESPHYSGAPVTVFGHSMGAIVAFEFVRLAEAANVPVRKLNVSGAVAPFQTAAKPAPPEEDEALLDHLGTLEGTNSAVMANRELMRAALPVVKRDHAAWAAYSCTDDIKIGAPILVTGGDQDPIVSMSDLHGWRKHSADVEVVVFEGGHFYLNNSVDAIAELVSPRT